MKWMVLNFGQSKAHRNCWYVQGEKSVFDTPVQAYFCVSVLYAGVCRVRLNKYNTLSANRSSHFYTAQRGIKSCSDLGFKRLSHTIWLSFEIGFVLVIQEKFQACNHIVIPPFWPCQNMLCWASCEVTFHYSFSEERVGGSTGVSWSRFACGCIFDNAMKE